MEWIDNQVNNTHTIASNIRKISQNVVSMRKMVNQMKTQDSADLRSQLSNIQVYTRDLAKDTCQLLMDYMKQPLNLPEQTTLKLARQKLSEDYMSTLDAFQAVQRAAAEVETQDLNRRIKPKNIHLDPPPQDAPRSSPQQRIQLEMDQPTEEELEDLEQRERDIRQLENNITDVNQIFKELGAAIHEQGSIVDSIESSVERTSENIEAGTQQLRQASGYQNKLRKRKVYIAIILTIVISIILILIFHN